MSIFLNKRKDGSIALFIDGDLQFDQSDEKIYHEGLALPALGLSCSRLTTKVITKTRPLKALIVGGGDGLIARDLLNAKDGQHNSNISIDLVDYSAEMIALAKSDLAQLNENSLSDDRVTVHIEDAWKFATNAKENARRYDLIVVDLTVAKEASGARFHSVDWYRSLAALVSPSGIVAVNCVSPTNTPRAYWSIFNSMLTAGLKALPYRVMMPSFSRLGYGPDWGFMLASKTAIEADEFDTFPGAEEKVQQLKEQFVFAKSFVDLQKGALPAENGSTIFLHYLLNDDAFSTSSTAENSRWNALKADMTSLIAPPADRGRALLPPAVRDRLAQRTAEIFPEGDQGLLHDVLTLMPTLQPAQTRQLIAQFIQNPAAYLEGLDIRVLVGSLVKRASELPTDIAAELRLLHEKLNDWSGDLELLLNLGKRVVTTLAVVVILANFIAPDAAYGKGEHGGGGHEGGAGNRVRAADRGRDNRGWNRNWGRPGHWGRWGYGGYGWGWGGGYYGGGYGSGPAYQVNNYSSGQTPDSQGNQYPSRGYNLVQTYGTVPDQPWVPPAGAVSNNDNNSNASTGTKGDTATTSVSANILNSAYRLGPDVDILSSGTTVVPLSNNAYIKVGPQASDLIDQKSGKTLISLYTDPALTWHISSELKQQASGLKQVAQGGVDANSGTSGTAADSGGNGDDGLLPAEIVPGNNSSTGNASTALKDAAESKNMLATVQLLNKAEQSLGNAPEAQPQPASAPVPGAFELFNSAWADATGKYVIMKKPDGSLVYLDGHAWYSDAGQTKLALPYPVAIKPVIASYLSDLAQDSASTRDSLAQEQEEVQTHLAKLKDHLSKLQSGATGVIGPNGELTTGQSNDSGNVDLVQFGTKKIPRAEAIKRLQSMIDKAQKRLDAAQNEAKTLPQETDAVNKLLSVFQG